VAQPQARMVTVGFARPARGGVQSSMSTLDCRGPRVSTRGSLSQRQPSVIWATLCRTITGTITGGHCHLMSTRQPVFP